MMGDRRKLVTNILGPREEKKEEVKGEDEALKTLAQEFIDAVHSKSVDEVVSAFRAMFLQCESMPHAEYGEED